MAFLALSHVGICVSDLDRAIAFYRDVLGFREAFRIQSSGTPTETLLELPGARLEAVFLERDGTRIELLHYAVPGHCGDGAPRPMNRLGLSHLSLRVDDLAETLEKLERAGVNVLHQSRTEVPAMSASAAFVTDPDGTRIELVQLAGKLGPGVG